MACLTTSPYNVELCTDANNYSKTATTMDWELKFLANPAGVTYSYEVYMEWYEPYNGWSVIRSAKGEIEKTTGLKSFSLSGVPSGKYRIRLRFQGVGSWIIAYTTEMTVVR